MLQRPCRAKCQVIPLAFLTNLCKAGAKINTHETEHVMRHLNVKRIYVNRV